MAEPPPMRARRKPILGAILRVAAGALIRAAAASLFLAVGAVAPHAQNAKPTIIRGEVVEVHDRLPPNELLGVEHKHAFTFTLSGANSVSETWANSYLNKDGSFWLKTASANSANLGGEDSQKIVWKVLGDRQLRRIDVGIQTITLWTISIDKDNHCKLDVAFLLQKGFTDIIAKREDNGQMAHFSLPRVVSASCTIE
jgi:hypothetical protein